MVLAVDPRGLPQPTGPAGFQEKGPLTGDGSCHLGDRQDPSDIPNLGGDRDAGQPGDHPGAYLGGYARATSADNMILCSNYIDTQVKLPMIPGIDEDPRKSGGPLHHK